MVRHNPQLLVAVRRLRLHLFQRRLCRPGPPLGLENGFAESSILLLCCESLLLDAGRLFFDAAGATECDRRVGAYELKYLPLS